MFEEIVKNYIDSELEDKEYCEKYEGIEEDIDFLNSLTDEDIKEIALEICEDEGLQEEIQQCLNYYVYHH